MFSWRNKKNIYLTQLLSGGMIIDANDSFFHIFWQSEIRRGIVVIGDCRRLIVVSGIVRDCLFAELHSTVSCPSDCKARGCKFEFRLGHINFVEIVHEIISRVIISLLLI